MVIYNINNKNVKLMLWNPYTTYMYIDELTTNDTHTNTHRDLYIYI